MIYTFVIPTRLRDATAEKNRSKFAENAVAACNLRPELLCKSLIKRLSSGEVVTESTKVSLRLSIPHKEALTQLAERSGLSSNQVLALAMEAHLLE